MIVIGWILVATMMGVAGFAAMSCLHHRMNRKVPQFLLVWKQSVRRYI